MMFFFFRRGFDGDVEEGLQCHSGWWCKYCVVLLDESLEEIGDT